MQLYDCKPAPSPRRVRIFMAEKGIAIPTIQVDLRAGEQFTPAFSTVNPQCVVPYLVLDDGTGICEVPAIWRYLEESYPSPPLMGIDAKDKALVAMWERRAELEGFLAVGEAFRNSSPAFKDHALSGPHIYAQIPALVERGKARFADFLGELDGWLAAREFVAGPRYTVADITALVAVDFAGWMKIAIPAECRNVRRWYDAVAARPSAKA